MRRPRRDHPTLFRYFPEKARRWSFDNWTVRFCWGNSPITFHFFRTYLFFRLIGWYNEFFDATVHVLQGDFTQSHKECKDFFVSLYLFTILVSQRLWVKYDLEAFAKKVIYPNRRGGGHGVTARLGYNTFQRKPECLLFDKPTIFLYSW